MTANAAFAAALMTFLIVAWTAGELAFLAPFKALLFHRHGMGDRWRHPVAFPQPLRALLRHRTLGVPARHRTQAPARGRATPNGRRTS